MSKERITILMCSNAAGTKCLKPWVIGKSQNPRAFKGLNKDNLPVHYRANTKAWMTSKMFEEWYNKSFVPEVKTFLTSKNLEFKVLLILDNAPSHPQTLGNQNIRVEFLPPNTTSVIQPLDQGIISTFKKIYIKRTFEKLFDSIDKQQMTLTDAWKSFTILDAVKTVGRAANQIKESTLKNCWKNLIVPSDTFTDVTEEDYTEEIVKVAKQIGGEGFDTMESADIVELLEEEPMGVEQALNLIPEEEDEQEDNEGETESAWNLRDLRDGFQLADTLVKHFKTADPSPESFVQFQEDIQRSLLRYQMIKNEMEKELKQTKISNFFKKQCS